jgi:phospholipase/carboxylesterase
MNQQLHLHQGQPILYQGVRIEQAKAAMILLHGRGATAEDILTLTAEFPQPGFAYLAPQATDYAWYPNRFVAPVSSNEPYLSSALTVIDDLIKQVTKAGISLDKTILLGFSQGACLALEYAARHPQQYGGVAGLSGGLIGDTLPEYSGSLASTPVFLGCSDVDFHIPKERVFESATIFRHLGADVTERLYSNMGHTINQDELNAVSRMMTALTAR